MEEVGRVGRKEEGKDEEEERLRTEPSLATSA